MKLERKCTFYLFIFLVGRLIFLLAEEHSDLAARSCK